MSSFLCAIVSGLLSNAVIMLWTALVVLDLHGRDEAFFPSMAGSRTIPSRCTDGTIANLFSGLTLDSGGLPSPRINSFPAAVRKVSFAGVRRAIFSLDSTRLDSTRLDPTRLDSSRLDSTRLDFYLLSTRTHPRAPIGQYMQVKPAPKSQHPPRPNFGLGPSKQQQGAKQIPKLLEKKNERANKKAITILTA